MSTKQGFMSTKQGKLLQLTLAGAATAAALGLAACKSETPQQAAIIQQADAGTDPAMANVCPTGTAAPTSAAVPTNGKAAPIVRVAGQSTEYAPQQQAESYPQSGAPAQDYDYNDPSYADPGYNDVNYVAQSDQAPPPLPEYDQPPSPGPNYYWTPGYWGWGDAGYYWVPGVWVAPPYYGALWTPPYWGWYGGHYLFHRGYWGHHIGFYGGINYGFGYIGIGYFGGFWHGNDFYYNRSVTNVGHVTNVYNRTVVYNNVRYGAQPVNRVSFNGGRGGIERAPAPFERQAMREQHVAPVAAQNQVHNFAAADPKQRFSANQGRPQQVAFNRPEAVSEAAARNHIDVNTPPARANFAGQPGAAGRPGNAVQPGVVNRGAEMNRGNEARPGVPNGNNPAANREMTRGAQPGTRPVAPGNRNGFEGRSAVEGRTNAAGAQPNTVRGGFNNNAHPTPQPERSAPMARPQPERTAPAARPEPMQRPAPQPRMEGSRPAPQPHVEAPRAAPAPHVEAPRPAPQQHAAPAPHEGGGNHGHR